jgi:3-deoxy-D-manno-octulosonate 8-phosphate phosphatase (KDO 8-P phosphatase)
VAAALALATEAARALAPPDARVLASAGALLMANAGDEAPLRERLRALGVTHARFGTEDKRPAAEAILTELGLDWSQAAAMGDDWPDLPMMRRAALACAPANAHAEVLAQAHWVTQRSGGNGAVRELCDLLLSATGMYEQLLQVYGE